MKRHMHCDSLINSLRINSLILAEFDNRYLQLRIAPMPKTKLRLYMALYMLNLVAQHGRRRIYPAFIN
jgi:hypothetical protein